MASLRKSRIERAATMAGLFAKDSAAWWRKASFGDFRAQFGPAHTFEHFAILKSVEIGRFWISQADSWVARNAERLAKRAAAAAREQAAFIEEARKRGFVLAPAETATAPDETAPAPAGQ